MNQISNVRTITQAAPTRFDALKWTVVSFLVIGGIVANTHFSSIPWAVRAAVGMVLLVVAVFTALQTATGQLFWSFVKGARIELRKVVWPTRPETIHTTLIVVGMVVVAALILCGIDKLFFCLVGWLTGQRG
ncbi:MAG: preprotein translocase subunit SecE [Gammaproteobacteria bacterium]|nr:preprotein translocase subunit SecE [Gammaproteobacteria bacterium]